jgi:WD40 repeat protein
VSAERRQIELNARQRLAVAQGNLKRLETARNQAQQQVTQFQRQKTILEGERQIILAQKLEAESRTRKSQEELNRIEKNLQTNLRQLDRVDKSLRAAEQARQVAIKETQLEQRGISLARRFEKGGEGQISLLLEAMKAGQELQAMTKAGLTDEYSTPSFLYALHTIIDGIRELNSISVKSPVFKTMLSSDGKCIAISAWDGVFLWHLDKNLLIEFKVNEESTTEILFSPDNKYVLTASENYNARLWDLQGNLLVEFKGHSDFVTSLAFSSNGKYLATGSRDGTAYIWDLQGNLITKFKAYDKSSIESIAFNPDGNYLMTGLDDSSRNDSDDNIHRIWDLKGNLIGEFKSHARAVFSPNGKYLATGSSDGNIRLWDLQGNLIAKFQKSKDFIESLIFSPDGKYLITRSELGFPRLWDLQGNMIKELKRDNQWDKQYTSSGDILGFDRDGKYLITDLGNSSFGFWDLQGNLIKEFKIHTDDGVTTIAFSPDEKYFVTGSSGGFTVSFWTTLQDNSLTKFKVDSGVNSIAFSSNSQYITTGNSNEIVHLWNLQGNLIREFKTIASDNIVKFSSDGKYLAAASDTLSDPLFYLWDLQGNLIRKSKESELHIMGSMNFSPDGKFLGIGFRNGTARIWNLQSNFTREFFVDKSYVDVASVAFSSDNKYFINGTENGYIYIWNVQGSFIRKFKVSSGSYPSSLALSPDGKLLATGLGMYANSPSNDSIILWDLQGKLIAKFKGYRPSVVYSIEFSPDGKYLATGSSDNTARLWDLKGNILAEFKGHQGDVSSVAFSPDGQYLATGSSDKTARLWRIEGLDELLVRGCHWLKDYFVSHPRDLQELPVCQQALKTSR